MPIRPEFRHFYRCPEWREARARVLKRAGDRCEQCGKPNGQVIFTYTWQTWRCSQFPFGREKVYHMVWTETGTVWRDQFGQVAPKSRWPCKGLPRRIKAQIGVAHADNEPANGDDSNLHAWCNWCHLHHDQPFHKLTRSIRKDAGRPMFQEAV